MTGQRERNGSCALPPALDDLALIAAMDNEAHPEIIEHLHVCESCTEQVRALATFQGLIRQQLYRLFCPTSAELSAFQQGLLSYDQAVKLVDHLLTCPHCAYEIRLLHNITSDIPADEQIVCA